MFNHILTCTPNRRSYCSKIATCVLPHANAVVVGIIFAFVFVLMIIGLAATGCFFTLKNSAVKKDFSVVTSQPDPDSDLKGVEN